MIAVIRTLFDKHVNQWQVLWNQIASRSTTLSTHSTASGMTMSGLREASRAVVSLGERLRGAVDYWFTTESEANGRC